MFLEASVDTGSCEKCFICIVIITRTSAPGCIYILMFYSSPLSNAPLNYTERRQCQTPIAPNLLLFCVKQQPSNLAPLITAHHTHHCSHTVKYSAQNRYKNLRFSDYFFFSILLFSVRNVFVFDFGKTLLKDIGEL